MTIGTQTADIATAGAAFAEFAERHAVPAGVRRSVSVALDELLQNAISYGFAGRRDGEVAIDVELLADRLTVTVSDDGAPFDPLEMAAPDITLTAEQRLPGGLGVHLVRRLMDEVGYQRRGGRNVVTMAKRLAADTAGNAGGGD